MDKFKEKLNLLRDEADQANQRVATLEESLKKMTETLQSKDNELLSQQNKIVLLTKELERAESRVMEGKLKKQESESQVSQSESFQRKLSLLEAEVEVSQRQVKEANEK